MLNILFIFVVLFLSLYVIKPLFSHNDKTIAQLNKKTARIEDLVFQRELLNTTIQELNFEHQMGKISDNDFNQIMNEHQQSLNGLEKQIQFHSGKTMENIQKKLEQEIARKKQNLGRKK
ncbi:hypothetical protein JXQ31_19825 [candidate division KSB1 bacterium]|nr:hypothetical protein [candidate division KSB1 bacterium]